MEITPAHRFAAHALLTDLHRQGGDFTRTAIALRNAQHWEGFPESYSPNQVHAAQTLLVAVTSSDDRAFNAAVTAVLNRLPPLS